MEEMSTLLLGLWFLELYPYRPLSLVTNQKPALCDITWLDVVSLLGTSTEGVLESPRHYRQWKHKKS